MFESRSLFNQGSRMYERGKEKWFAGAWKVVFIQTFFSSSFQVEVTGEGDNQTSIDQKWGLLKKWEVQSTEKSNKN